jgi:P2-related tail formation protein
MSTLLRKSKLIDACTSSISYDAQVKSACKAFDEQMYEIIDDTGQVIMIPNIMELTDETLVDILAWQFHVDFYDKTRDLEFRKRLVQMSIIWHKTKGTVALVEEVINTYWPGSAYLQEWFEYSAWGYKQITFVPADVSASLNRFTKTAHGFVNGDAVWFAAGAQPPPNQPSIPTASVLPVPLDRTLYYYIVAATSTTFQVSLSVGGAVVDIIDAGLGTNTIFKKIDGAGFPPNYPVPGWHDRYRFRVVIDDAIVDPEVEAQVMTLIDRYKPVSRWPEANLRPRASSTEIFASAYATIRITRISEAPTNYIPSPP